MNIKAFQFVADPDIQDEFPNLYVTTNRAHLTLQKDEMRNLIYFIRARVYLENFKFKNIFQVQKSIQSAKRRKKSKRFSN